MNGHLTSANSDVRAGGNYDHHQRRWSGLGNWWQRFLELFSVPVPADGAPDTGVIPARPRLASDAPIASVVEDFLVGWLVVDGIAFGSREFQWSATRRMS